jgi:hypothetical protein
MTTLSQALFAAPDPAVRLAMTQADDPVVADAYATYGRFHGLIYIVSSKERTGQPFVAVLNAWC